MLGGSGEIRTHERLTPSAVFKTPAFVIIINNLLTFHFRKEHCFSLHKCLFYQASQESCGNDFSGKIGERAAWGRRRCIHPPSHHPCRGRDRELALYFSQAWALFPRRAMSYLHAVELTYGKPTRPTYRSSRRLGRERFCCIRLSSRDGCGTRAVHPTAGCSASVD